MNRRVSLLVSRIYVMYEGMMSPGGGGELDGYGSRRGWELWRERTRNLQQAPGTKWREMWRGRSNWSVLNWTCRRNRLTKRRLNVHILGAPIIGGISAIASSVASNFQIIITPVSLTLFEKNPSVFTPLTTSLHTPLQTPPENRKWKSWWRK